MISLGARLLVPAAIGVAGFLGNSAWIFVKTNPHQFVGVRHDIPTGEPIQLHAIEPVPLPGRDAVMNRDLIRWEERGLVVEAFALRPLRSGALMVMSDVSVEREPPSGYHLLYIDLERVAFRPDRLRAGSQVSFLTRNRDEGETELQLGPLEVFEPPVIETNDPNYSDRGQVRICRPLSVLVQADDPSGEADRLRRAISTGAILALELVSPDR